MQSREVVDVGKCLSLYWSKTENLEFFGVILTPFFFFCPCFPSYRHPLVAFSKPKTKQKKWMIWERSFLREKLKPTNHNVPIKKKLGKARPKKKGIETEMKKKKIKEGQKEKFKGDQLPKNLPVVSP